MINILDKHIQVTACIVHLVEAKQALILAACAPSEVLPIQTQIEFWAEQLKRVREHLAHKYAWPLDDDFGIHKIGDHYVILFESGRREERKP